MKQNDGATDDSARTGTRRSRRAFLGTTATLGAIALVGCTGSDDGGDGGMTTEIQESNRRPNRD
ncbi:hypothetical protein [Haladaptatus cibarius]|uniref:hypothetical protein n=1 Tax=Haladaptatus cibarius TaxID=453847 RepID=UPI000A046872|nr:hypothetical protein [Haladaptatus cibarius]